MSNSEKHVKVILQAIAPGVFGGHRVAMRFTQDELAAALAWLNSDEPEAPVAAPPRDDDAVPDAEAASDETKATAARKRGKR